MFSMGSTCADPTDFQICAYLSRLRKIICPWRSIEMTHGIWLRTDVSLNKKPVGSFDNKIN